MPPPQLLTTTADNASRSRKLALVMISVACLFFALHGYRNEQRKVHGIDFEAVYGGSRCLIAHCNPYDSDQTRVQYLAHGGNPSDSKAFEPHFLGYPPNSLFVFLPFALLPAAAAMLFWSLAITMVFILAVFAMADLCLPFSPLLSTAASSIFVASSSLLLAAAQPATLAIGLCCIAVWCFIRRRQVTPGIACFAVSLVIKPQLGASVLVYFLLANTDYRKIAARVILVTVLLSVPGIVWASVMPQSRHWVHDLGFSLNAMAATGRHSDPSPANDQADQQAELQTVIRYFRDDKNLSNHLTWGVCGVLLIAWIYPVVRMRSGLLKDYLCLAAIAPLSMLPIYHRNYDTRLLLLTFPAFAFLLASRRVLATMATLVTIVMIGLTYPQLTYLHQFLMLPDLLHIHQRNWILTAFVVRPVPSACLLTALFYLACCYMVMQNRTPNHPA